MTFLPRIRPGDEVPLYRQIVHQVRDAIAGGRLEPGDRLPSHRELALQLVVAPLTVKKAYDELESEGLIETRRGRGTFVAAREADEAEAARARLHDSIERLVIQAELQGLSSGELLEEVRRIAAARASAAGREDR